MSVLSAPELPATYSARRALSQFFLTCWVLVSLVMALFHIPNAISASDATWFYGGEIVGCLCVARLFSRDNDLLRGAATTFVVMNAFAWLVTSGLYGFLFIAIPGSLFLALVWGQPPHADAGRLEGRQLQVLLVVLAAVALTDFFVISGAFEIGLRDDACFVWCE